MTPEEIEKLTQPQEPQVAPQVPAPQTEQPAVISETPPVPEDGKKKTMMIIGAVLVLLILAAVGAFAFTQMQKPKEIVTETTPYPTPETMTEREPREKATVPNDWAYESSSVCNIEIPIPPNKEPYSIPNDPNNPPAVNDEGAFWQFREGTEERYLFTGAARAIIVQPDAASGYIPGAVDVWCAENDNNYTAQAVVEEIESTFAENPASDPIGQITIENKRPSTMWGLPVYVVNFEGGMYGDEDYYFVATKSHVYMIRQIVQSTNPNIVSATDQVFENIKFN